MNRIKKGDNVRVIAGKDKGREGKSSGSATTVSACSSRG